MRLGHLVRACVLAVGFALAGGLASGCGGSIEISDAPMSGVIGGDNWTFGSGETLAALSKSDQFWVNAYQEAVAPCTGAGDQVSSNRLIINAPKVAGSYRLGLGLNVTFYVQTTAKNFVATTGRIVVSQVTDTMLSGGGHFIFDGANEVNGQFQAQICPP
jgi:hypothetical protein